MESAHYRNLFLDETSARLSLVAKHLGRLVANPDASDALADVFREVHSFKGNASAVGYHRLAELAHAMEDVLQFLSETRLPRTARIFASLLDAWDLLARAFGDLANESGLDFSSALLELHAIKEQASPAAFSPSTPEALWPGSSSGGSDSPVQRYQVCVELDDACLLRSARVLAVIANLELLGTVLNVNPSLDDIEAAHDLQTFRLELVASSTAEAIHTALMTMPELKSIEVVFSQPHGAFPQPDGTGVRFQRNLREVLALCEPLVAYLASDLGKEVELRLECPDALWLPQDTASSVSDIVLQLIRNAMDHGIEGPETRLAASKTRTARVSVAVALENSCLHLRVEDDGRGLDYGAIRQRAIDMGRLSDTQGEGVDTDALSDLILQAGFSTAAEVSHISGRGVGLDIVRHRVEALGAELAVHSVEGQGTNFYIRIPLTDSVG